jgi:hypothetical protein
VVAGSPNGQAVKGGLFCHVAEQGLPEPAFVAASDKTLIKGKRTQVESMTVPHKTTVPQRKKEEKKPSKGEIKDPYWEPCDYGSTNGPNAFYHAIVALSAMAVAMTATYI